MKNVKSANYLRRMAFVVFLMLSPLVMFAQNITVKGTVADAAGEVIIGATIVVQGEPAHGTATDIDGKYTLSGVAPTATLVVSYVGMKPQHIYVNGRAQIDIVMQDDNSLLDEIVVVGYSTQSRSQMTTSVSKLDTKNLASAPRSNVATALQGNIAGLKVTQVSGQPGETPKMVLRGGTGFDGTGDPLILIDGVPGSFYALNGDDVESIEVLKDAASTAIYGARAANGVILVTTKKGKAGHSNITFRSKFTVNKPTKDPMRYLGAADYVKFNRLAVRNSQMVRNQPDWLNQFLTGNNSAGTGNNTLNSIYTTMYLTDANRYLLNHAGWQSIKDPTDPTKELIFQENRMDNLFYQSSHAQDYSLAFDGGNEKGTYYLGLGFLDDKGLVFGSAFKRYSGTFNASYKMTDALKVSSNVMYMHSNRNLPFESEYNLFQRTAGLAPVSRIYNNNPDGSLSGEYQPGTYVGFGNPLYYRDKFDKYNLEQRISATAQIDYAFLNNFTFTLRGSHFSVNNSDESFNKAYLNSGSLITDRESRVKHERKLRNQVTALLNYNNSFAGKHNVSALLGGEYFIENVFKSESATRLSPTDRIPTMNVGSEAKGVPFSERTAYAISSVFGQVNYDYAYKYLLGLTFRYDGTSRLGNNKYGFFPGISFGWNMHNEDFIKDTPASKYLSRIKPRVSYGVNGNIEVLSNFGIFGRYGKIPDKNNTITSIYDTQTGYVNTALPLLDLRWERSTTFNVGLDVGLFENRVTLIADYFIRNVNDKLSNLTLPLWTGFSSIQTNNGTLQNRGLELQLNADVIKGKDFTWNVGATFYRIRNYAKKLPNNGVDKNRQGGVEIFDPATGKTKYVGGLQEGERLGYDVITAYVSDGVYKTQAEIDAHKNRTVEFAFNKKQRFLGDTRWKDINGDGVIDYLDRVVIGRTTPDIMGGITTDLSYKNFSLFVKTDFALGHYIINGRRVKGIAQTQGNQNGPLEIRDSWTPENPTSNVPRFDLVDQQRNHLANGFDQGSLWDSSSRYWEKGDYLALREITLSYTLGKKLLGNVIKDARFYLTGTNLAYLTGFSGSLPEEVATKEDGERGQDRGRFPLPRTFTLGLNLTF